MMVDKRAGADKAVILERDERRRCENPHGKIDRRRPSIQEKE